MERIRDRQTAFEAMEELKDRNKELIIHDFSTGESVLIRHHDYGKLSGWFLVSESGQIDTKDEGEVVGFIWKNRRFFNGWIDGTYSGVEL